MVELYIPPATPEPEPPKVKPTPIPLVLPPAAWGDPAKHLKRVELAFGPYAVAGRQWAEVYIRRLTAGQWQAYYDNRDLNRKNDPSFEAPRIPMCVDERGNNVPEELYDQLFPDDLQDVNEAVFAWLPRSYRSPTPTEETPASSASTAPNGATSSASS